MHKLINQFNAIINFYCQVYEESSDDITPFHILCIKFCKGRCQHIFIGFRAKACLNETTLQVFFPSSHSGNRHSPGFGLLSASLKHITSPLTLLSQLWNIFDSVHSSKSKTQEKNLPVNPLPIPLHDWVASAVGKRKQELVSNVIKLFNSVTEGKLKEALVLGSVKFYTVYRVLDWTMVLSWV